MFNRETDPDVADDEALDPRKLPGYGGWFVTTIPQDRMIKIGDTYIKCVMAGSKIKLYVCAPKAVRVDRMEEP